MTACRSFQLDSTAAPQSGADTGVPMLESIDRRRRQMLLRAAVTGGFAMELAQAGAADSGSAQTAASLYRLEPLRSVEAGVLNIAYYEEGPADGPAVVLLHGFPYDIHSYVDVAPLLATKGCRVIIPYVRGCGPTRFLDSKTPRSGEQAAVGADLIALIDALGIQRAVFAGYDWGGRAAWVGAALWPDRCEGLVTVNGYQIQKIARAMIPATPTHEVAYWYQYYFHIKRGRGALAANAASAAT